MPLLVAPGITLGIDEIRDRRAAMPDRGAQYLPDRLPQSRKFRTAQTRREARRMNARLPQAFVRINISQAAKYALIQKQRLDPGPAFCQLPPEIRNGNSQRVRA